MSRIPNQYICEFEGDCNFTARRANIMDRHRYNQHTCSRCGRLFLQLNLHDCDHPEQHGNGAFGPQDLELGRFLQVESSQGGILKSYRYKNDDSELWEIVKLVEFLQPDIYSLMNQVLTFFTSVKVQISIEMLLIDEKTDSVAETFFNSPYYILAHSNFIEDIIFKAVDYLITVANSWNEKGSGWSILSIEALRVNFAKFRPFRPRSYIKTPDSLRGRKGLVNPKNEDNECFKYAVLACLHHSEVGKRKRDKETIKRYKNYEVLYDWSMLKFPVAVDRTKSWENKNQIGVNIFGYEDEIFFPIKVTNLQTDKIANVMLISEFNQQHYIAIVDFSRFMGESGMRAHHFCMTCLNTFGSKERLDRHNELCGGYGLQTISMPEMNKDGTPRFYKFKDYYKTYPTPYWITFDLETIAVKIPNKKSGNTTYLSKFECVSYCFVLCGMDGSYEVFSYTGEGALELFLRNILEVARSCLERMKEDVGCPPLTPSEQYEFDIQTNCFFCGINYELAGVEKVRHHFHGVESAKFITGCCADCNLNIKPRNYIPAFSLNGQNFDHRIICQGFSFDFIEDVSILPINSQKFNAITINRIVRFTDVMSKIPGSLDALVRTALESKDDVFKFTKDYFRVHKNNLEEILQKQKFPYEWLDSFEKLTDKQLPPRKEWFNRLTNSETTEDEYKHALKMFKMWGSENVGSYLNTYCIIDTLTLCDIHNDFRRKAIVRSGLDPNLFVSGSSFSYNACLYTTRARFELIHCPTLYNVFTSSLRGGIVTVSKRYEESTVNSLAEPRKQIAFFDVISLYSYALCLPLPVHSFTELSSIQLERLSSDDYYGLRNFRNPNYSLVVCVDWLIPLELHEKLKSFPPLPEKLAVNTEMLSDYQKTLIRGIDNAKSSINQQRLILHLFPRKKYICHLSMLQFCMQLGCKVTNLHYGYSFVQEPIFKPYIEKNISLRAKTEDEVERQMYKNLSNHLYGYTLLSQLNKDKVVVCFDPVKVECEIARPSFKDVIQISENSTIIVHRPTLVEATSPIYFGWAVLELSKLRMYELYYGTLVPCIGPSHGLQLCYMDTDSLLISCDLKQGESSIYELLKDSDEFDFSNLPKNHPCYSLANKGVAGKLKSEYPLHEIMAYVGLSPKLYSLQLKSLEDESEKQVKKGKGVSRSALKELKFSQYKDAVFNDTVVRQDMYRIQSDNQHLFLVKVNKKALSALHLKGFVCEDKISVLPFGFGCQ